MSWFFAYADFSRVLTFRMSWFFACSDLSHVRIFKLSTNTMAEEWFISYLYTHYQSVLTGLHLWYSTNYWLILFNLERRRSTERRDWERPPCSEDIASKELIDALNALCIWYYSHWNSLSSLPLSTTTPLLLILIKAEPEWAPDEEERGFTSLIWCLVDHAPTRSRKWQWGSYK